MITTREQVADLRPGDVVELFRNSWPDGTIVRGPLYEVSGWLYVAERAVRSHDNLPALGASYSLTVVSRAPRPLYVNHPRTKPVLGDVVRRRNGEIRYAMPREAVPASAAYADTEIRWWGASSEFGEWLHCSTDYMGDGLTLLVDGETGQVVP